MREPNVELNSTSNSSNDNNNNNNNNNAANKATNQQQHQNHEQASSVAQLISPLSSHQQQQRKQRHQSQRGEPLKPSLSTPASKTTSSTTVVDLRQQQHQTSLLMLDGDDDTSGGGNFIKASGGQSAGRVPAAIGSKGERAPQKRQHLQQQQQSSASIDSNANAINYWHYKQTGIKSRPIQLLKHPIEHIERKIIITYMLGFLFKLIAILTGPLIVLVVYLITVPFTVLRRFTWFVLNLQFTFDARISTIDLDVATINDYYSTKTTTTKQHQNTSHNGQKTDCQQQNPGTTQQSRRETNLERQIFWNYCPLSYIETYWLRDKLVNNVVLVIENERGTQFSIDKLRSLVKDNILSKPVYRKFLSRVVTRGFPLYKSHYWHYLGLANNNEETGLAGESRNEFVSPAHTTTTGQVNRGRGESVEAQPGGGASVDGRSMSSSSSSNSIFTKSSADQFSVTSIGPQQHSVHIIMPLVGGNQLNKNDDDQSSNRRDVEQVCLRNHIYLDHSLKGSSASYASIRRYTHKLLGVGMNMARPLWEIRVIPSVSNRKTYIIFRCHQSLADGRTLSKILTDHLTTTSTNISKVDLCHDERHINSSLPTNKVGIPPTHLDIANDSPGPNEDLEKVTEDHSPSPSSDDGQHILSAESPITSYNNKIKTKLNNLNDDQLYEDDVRLRPIKEKLSFISRVSKSNSLRSAIFVGPLTVLLWVIWAFTRRKNNHLNKCLSEEPATKKHASSSTPPVTNKLSTMVDNDNNNNYDSSSSRLNERRFYMAHYNLTKFYRIKQMTRSTVSDVILCALSGALRDYLRKFNGISNPPNLNVSLTVDMRQPENRDDHLRTSRACSQLHHHYNHHHQAINDGARERADNADNSHQLFAASTTASAAAAAATKGKAAPVSSSSGNPRTAYSANSGGTMNEFSYYYSELPQVNCTLVNVPLPTSVEGTVPRLWELRNTMDELRTSADPWVMLGLQHFLFTILPYSWYQWIINHIALRNSSTFVSNIRGPQNMVEAWCVDLLQRAIMEAQQPPRAFRPTSVKLLSSSSSSASSNSGSSLLLQEQQTGADGGDCKDGRSKGTTTDQMAAAGKLAQRLRSKQKRASRLKCMNQLGSVSAIYYCMQPPTSNIPISFNCITYHDKMFVTSLSRSLLVEDSKLLVRLFFRQLNQLADTIAKRKSLVTIIRTPVPIEISCQPASPAGSSDKKSISNEIEFITTTAATTQDEVIITKNDLSNEQEYYNDNNNSGDKRRVLQTASSSPRLFGVHKDDIEANIGTHGRADRCQTCQQSICTCSRRKSLFSFDYNKQRAVNLLSLMNPSHFASAMRTSRSNENNENIQRSASECLCGQQLLEELDEESPGGGGNAASASGGDGDREISSAGSVTPSDDGGGGGSVRAQQRLSARPCCAKCRAITQRSSLSLDASTDDHKQGKNKSAWSSQTNQNIDEYSNLSIDRKRGTVHSSTQLMVPHNEDGFRSRQHSKSETDLLPGNGGSVKNDENPRGEAKESWLSIGRRSYRKLSLFSRSNLSHQQSMLSSRTSAPHSNPNKSPVEWISGHFGGDSSRRRRQSVATTTGSSHIQRSVVVKDEINADVSLRYQLDGPFLGIRNRRFSTIGSAVAGNQRRASLIPFGLIHNRSLPKLFWDNGEAHL